MRFNEEFKQFSEKYAYLILNRIMSSYNYTIVLYLLHDTI